jgi:hypothetical protein
MSLFQVQLTQGVGLTAQGALDPSVVNGASIQRSIWVAGPNKTNRQLFDGATFTDVNYWKRFTYAVTGNYDTAFINVLSDDGSVWNDYGPENSFPRSYTLTVAEGSGYANNIINVLTDNGSPATFAQITNMNASGSSYILVQINGLSNATFPLYAGTTQTFDKGDLSITQLAFSDASSSTAGNTSVNVLLSFTPIAQS